MSRSDAEVLFEIDKLLSEVGDEEGRARIVRFLIDKHVPKMRGASVVSSQAQPRSAPEFPDKAHVEPQTSAEDHPLASGSNGQRWLRQAKLTDEELSVVFERSGSDVHLVLSKVPGSTQAEKTRAVHLLEGVRALLQTDTASIDPELTLALCKTFGCYNRGHHGEFRDSLKGRARTDKDGGLIVTNPGLTEAVQLIREAANHALSKQT